MSVRIESLGIAQLSVGDRLELIVQIWDSRSVEVGAVDVPEDHKVGLAKRCANAQNRPRLDKPWREVLRSLEGNP